MSEEETKGEKIDKKQLHVRYEWFDQFRGLLIIFLIISVVTWELSGNFSSLIPPIGPPLLNHGFYHQTIGFLLAAIGFL